MSGTGQGHQRGKRAQACSEEEPEPQGQDASRGSKSALWKQTKCLQRCSSKPSSWEGHGQRGGQVTRGRVVERRRERASLGSSK